MGNWTPADWLELAKVASSIVTTIGVPLIAVYTMRVSARIGVVSTNVDRLEKNTNSISERNQAIAMKLGITEGIAQERASVQANADALVSTLLPVSDAQTAAAVGQVVEAIKDGSGLSRKT